MWLAAGCGGADEAARRAPAVTSPPPPPAGALLAMSIPGNGTLYRVMPDGRYLVTPRGGDEREQRPLSKLERGRERVSEGGLLRIREALDESGFFALPDEVVTSDCIADGAALQGSRIRVKRQPIVFSATDGDRTRTVEAFADLRAPCTLGALGPLYRALDLEAIGDWMKE